MRVKVGSEYSTTGDTPFSVPQGSCLGPYLYLTYASTLDDVIDTKMGLLSGFVDDHGLRNHFSAKRAEEVSVMKNMESSLATIKH